MPAENLDVQKRIKGSNGYATWAPTIRESIKNLVLNALYRRAACEPPAIITAQLEDLTFEKIKDQHLYKAFARRFPTQFRTIDCIQLERGFAFGTSPATATTLDWKIRFDGKFNIEAVEGKHTHRTRPLFRHRDPEAFDALHAWLDRQARPLMEMCVGVRVFSKVMQCCQTTIDLNKLWPSLLKLDRSQRDWTITGRERPSAVELPEYAGLWISKVEEWIAEGMLTPEPKHSLNNTIKVHEGLMVTFDKDSVFASLDKEREAFKLPS